MGEEKRECNRRNKKSGEEGTERKMRGRSLEREEGANEVRGSRRKCCRIESGRV